MAIPLLSAFGGLKISRKLPMIIAGASLLLAVSIGTLSYIEASSATRSAINEKLTAVVEGRKAALSDYLASIEQDMRYTATNPTVASALQAFSAGWLAMGSDPQSALQRLYIDDNPNPTGQKDNLDAASDGSPYSRVHATYHPWFRQFLRERGYYDIFLFNLEGDLVYTVFKELDYATNLVSGEYKDTDLGNAFRAARDKPNAGSLYFFDFKPYAPSHGAPASFMSTPILGDAGQPLGVLVFQMPIDGINNVMGLDAGLGETGETMIVGEDQLMRNDSRLEEESTILVRKVDTEGVAAALAGKNGVALAAGHSGMEAVTAYTPLDFNGARWAIVAEVALHEAMGPIYSMRNMIFVIVLFALALVTGIGVFFSRSISGPLTAMGETMHRLAEGDTEAEIPGRDRRDEIGVMAQSVQVFKENAIERTRLEAEQRAEQAAREERANNIESLISDFDTSVNEVLGTVSTSSSDMEQTARSMSSTAVETSELATSVAAASEEASANVQTVASAAEELSSSIAEISQQVARSSTMADEASKKASDTDARVRSLAEAAQKIGDVVNLIQDIAEQTNLLALNATIEAARAGEMGKGFAVVAGEVKSLASQTAKATDEISAQISDVQASTEDAVSAINEITATIGQLNEISVSIASAVEEQGGATQEISRNVQEAAAGTRDVNSHVSKVNQAAGETGSSAERVLSSATEMSQVSESLRNQIASFLTDVRAA